ncbi:TIGR04222 domain-containing membrane protein [Streptomyces ziwulingensis]|uniref:TIGR04222 domain-containing membrane protein n=1 Tax=Streptomyces ziwulingensis TaxID=1045501 RepID=A0ABP9CM74_9ACTN
MDIGTGMELEPHEIALLAGGERAVVMVTVVALHLLGALETGPGGTLWAVGPCPDEVSPLEGTVRDCLEKPLTARELARDPDVRLALALTRIPLSDAGLLGYPRLRPNRTARRWVAFLRERHPLPAVRHGLTDEDTLLAVALHGEAALRVLLPRFALRAGLTDPGGAADPGGTAAGGRPPSRRERFLRWADAYGDAIGHGDRGDHGGGGFGCGGGGGGGDRPG